MTDYNSSDDIDQRSPRWQQLANLFRRDRQKSIAVIVDGPNILRKKGKYQVKLEDIDKAASSFGQIGERVVLLNLHASEKLIQAVSNSGYTPLVAQGDIHIELALLALEISHRNLSDMIMIGSRDARCTPVLMKLKEKGIKTAIVGFEPGFSVALKNHADYTINLFEN